jgi:hypothetical protein
MRCIEMPLSDKSAGWTFIASGLPRGVVRVNCQPSPFVIDDLWMGVEEFVLECLSPSSSSIN